jgi:hypothetical protein
VFVGLVRRSWCLDGCVNSGKDPLTEEERTIDVPAPANITSQEDSYYRKPQLRRANLSPEVTALHPVLRLRPCLPELALGNVRQLR